jgi:hypothetical protein
MRGQSTSVMRIGFFGRIAITQGKRLVGHGLKSIIHAGELRDPAAQGFGKTIGIRVVPAGGPPALELRTFEIGAIVRSQTRLPTRGFSENALVRSRFVSHR